MPQDYIMRLIEQIAALVASIVAKERAGLHSEASADLDEKTQQTIGMGIRDVRRLSPEALSRLLQSSGGLRYGRAVMLAELLLHDAVISEATGQDSDALLDYLHAFCLLSDSVDTLSEDDQAVYRPKLEALVTHLRSLPAHPYVAEKLFEYDSRPNT
jgi:hypothetical protein